MHWTYRYHEQKIHVGGSAGCALVAASIQKLRDHTRPRKSRLVLPRRYCPDPDKPCPMQPVTQHSPLHHASDHMRPHQDDAMVSCTSDLDVLGSSGNE